MLLSWRYEYRLDRDASTGALFDHVLSTLQASQGEFLTLRFAVQDSLHGKVSAVERILKRHPELAPLRYDIDIPAPQQLMTSPRGSIPGLSNVGVGWRESHPKGAGARVPAVILSEIAHGTPNAYPSDHAAFLFDLQGSSPSSATSTGSDPARLPAVVMPMHWFLGQAPWFHGALLLSSWWTTRRQLALLLSLPAMEQGNESDAPPSLPEVVQGVPERLGRGARKRAMFVLTQAEEQHVQSGNQEADQLLASWKTSMSDRLSNLGAHDLPEHPGSPSGSGLTSPHKTALMVVFKPRGYKYRSIGPGGLAVERTTPGGNHLTIEFDVGTWSHSCSCHILVEGTGWRRVFPLIATARQRHGQYPILNADTWAKIVENVALLVGDFEANLLPLVEAAFPRPPRWLAATFAK